MSGIQVTKDNVEVKQGSVAITSTRLIDGLIHDPKATLDLLSKSAGEPLTLDNVTIGEDGRVIVTHAAWQKGLEAVSGVHTSGAWNLVCGAGCA